MKVLALALAPISGSFAQASSQVEEAFLIRIQPVRATFAEDATKEEEKVMSEHFVYLKKLAADGKLELGGPSVNGEAEARKIMEGAPSLKAGIQKGELLPFRISILRGR